MSLQFADWYEGGYPDVELVVLDALQPVLDTVTVLDESGDPILDNGIPRRPQAVIWLPQQYTDHTPTIRVARVGGAADVDDLRDRALVQVACIADTLAESWQLLEFCRCRLLSYARGGLVHREDGSRSQIMSVEEMVGPQLLPELSPDERLVHGTFRVTQRFPRGLPDYEKVRESLAV